MSDDDSVTRDDRPTLPQRIGRYEVRALLGQGGHGRVYSAFDPELSRPVAIKVPRDQAEGDHRELFLLEARRLAQLRHPGIVALHDVGTDPETGVCFLVSDLLEGVELGQWLRTPRAWQEIVGIVAEIADALGYAHAHTTVHRDVKPTNIVVGPDGHPVLLDFGIAVSDVGSADSSGASGPDRRQIGTPVYMSPEQTAGEAHRIDGRTDIYGLGVVLYEALSGRVPFRAPVMAELFRKIRDDDPQPLRQLVPTLPAALEHVCHKAMSKRMQDRHANASDFASDLRRVLRDDRPRAGDAETLAETAAVPSSPSSSSRSKPTHTDERRPTSGEVERRHVTVLSCVLDLAGDDVTIDAEEQLALTVAFRRICADVAQRWQGAALPSSGASAILCFGYPQAFEDAARRAVQAALDVLAETTPLCARASGDRLNVWLTLHSSVALVGAADADGRLDVVGEARTVATRLEGATEPNVVTITEATHKLVAGFFDDESRGTRTIKGVSQPITVHHVRGPSKAQSRFELTEPAALSPLTGRDREVGLLLDRWEQALEGRGQVVHLVGEPGIGKSRLVHVLKERVTDGRESRTHAVVEWRCLPTHENSALYPAIDFFERTLAFSPDMPAAQKLDRLEKYLAGWKMDRPDSVALFAGLLSIPFADEHAARIVSPQRTKERTLEAMLDWTRLQAEGEPTLLIVEDLHWIDATTMELLAMLAAQLRTERLLAVFTFRPELALPLAPTAHVTQIALNRLTRRQTVELILKTAETRARAFSADLVDQVAARTDGVPLFVEELTRSVMEPGVLVNTIPATLHDLLLARLDRMTSERELLWIAATIGREASHEMLRAIAPMPDADLEAELARLVDAEILHRRGRPPHHTYVFKHALIQDAAYQSMVKAKRQRLHGAIARAIEERFVSSCDAQPELVGHHYTEAGAPELAVPYWERAGTRSQQRFAMPEAIGHFGRALELLATLEETPDRDRRELRIQTQLSVALTSARGWAAPEVAGVHARARELCVRLDDDVSLFHVMWGTWAWRLLRRELDTARALSDELLTVARAKGDAGYEMEACWAIGCTSLFRGELTRGNEHFARANELYDPERSRRHAELTGQDSGATLGAHWGWLLWHLGYPDRALARGREGVARARTVAHPAGHPPAPRAGFAGPPLRGDPFSLAFALYHLGCVTQHCGMTEETLSLADATIAIGEDQSFAIWKGLGTLCRGAGLAMAGRHDEGADLIGLGLRGFEATGAGLSATHYCCRLAEARLASGRLDEADQAIDDGLAIAHASNERFAEAELLRLRGEILCARGGAEERAIACFRDSIAVADRQDARSWKLRSTTSLARVLAAHGKREEAREGLGAIVSWFTEGTTSGDLVAARELLERLSAATSRRDSVV